MEAHAHCSLEAPSGRSAQPEPHWPPGLNREQAWAWALDNFPALSRPSCLSPDFRGDPHYCACGLRRHDCPGHADGPRVESGQKRWRDPQAQEPAASPGWSDGPSRRGQSHPARGPGGSEQPVDASSCGGRQTRGQIASGGPARPPPHPTPHTQRLRKTDLKPGGTRQGKE